MPRRRKSLLMATSVGVQHSDTALQNQGPASVPTSHIVLETRGGARPLSGTEQTIKGDATTGDTVNVGDTVKYINLFCQVAAREGVGSSAEETGWLEYGFIMVKESDTTVPNTQLGTTTLGDVLTKMWRNECIWTGNFPINRNGANSLSLKIKVPRFKQKIRLGDQWRFVYSIRSSSSTDVNTASFRTISSTIYKSYS